MSKQLQAMKPEQVKARSEQLKKLYAEYQAQRVATNHARWEEDQQEARVRTLADTQANNHIEAANKELEAAKVDPYKIASGASSGTQLDKANQHRRPQPYNRSRGQQHDNAHQPANLNTFILQGNLRIGQCHLLEILICKLVLSIMADQAHHARPGPPVNRQAGSHPSSTTTSLLVVHQR